MVIEHTFVTTMEAPETMRAAADLLSRRGFTSTGSAFEVANREWNTLEMRRGKTKAAKARNVAQLPQTAHIEWDRGRVSVALAIEPNAAWGGGGFALGFGLDAGTPDGKPKKMKLHTELLMAVARGLEAVLAHRKPPEYALAEWDHVEADIYRAARRRIWRNVIILVVFLALMVGLVTLAVMNA